MRHEHLLAFRIKSLNNQIRRLLERSAIVHNDANLTGMQYAILGFLSDHSGEDVFQRDIEAEFNIRRSTASGMLQLLEKHGYILRQGVPGDARLKKITMTEKALAVNKKARDDFENLQARLTAGLTAAELEQFYATLDKIARNAEA